MKAPLLERRMTCPGCRRRGYGLVHPECPICAGVGSLQLGQRGLSMHHPETVAAAVELVFESNAARVNAECGPMDPARADVLAATCRQLQTSGLLSGPLDGRLNIAPTPPAHTLADTLALARGNGAPVAGVPDLNRLAAPSRPYHPDDRPLAAGRMPTRSAAGSPSALAQAADPYLPDRKAAPLHPARVLAAAHHKLTDPDGPCPPRRRMPN